MVDTSWYPGVYYICPHYDSAPTINYWDRETFTARRRKYWNAAWTRALQRWAPVGLDLVFHPGPLGCPSPGVACEVVDIPPGIGAWTQFNEPPDCGFIEVDITTWQSAYRGRNIGPLTKVITHEVGHSLGFGHGGSGVMAVPLVALSPSAEEIAAARAYWGTG
jgi:hypothetical protein